MDSIEYRLVIKLEKVTYDGDSVADIEQVKRAMFTPYEDPYAMELLYDTLYTYIVHGDSWEIDND
jgi:hypothetical protein